MNAKIRSDFPVTEELTYLDTAYDGPYPVPVLEVGQEFLQKRSRGTGGRVPDWLEVLEQVREDLAGLIGAKRGEVAITTNTTHGTNIVVTSLRFEPGDNVVWDDLSFPSNTAVWKGLERSKGIENRVLKNKGGAVSLADYERVVDDRTRVISVSHVSHRNGYVYDLKGLADVAHAHGAYLHVDGIQAVGAIGVDVRSADVDFYTAGTYKWLLGPIGLAFFYVKEELLPELEPVHRGFLGVESWADDQHLVPGKFFETARKFETATVHFQGVFELKAALDYLSGVGMDKIEEQVLKLSSRVWRGMKGLGLPLFTPADPRSGIVTCVTGDGEAVGQLLRENNIVASINLGRELRVSPHFFNTEEEVDRLLSVLESRL
jgi:cysteine desulfurase/selenocysteine lyase